MPISIESNVKSSIEDYFDRLVNDHGSKNISELRVKKLFEYDFSEDKYDKSTGNTVILYSDRLKTKAIRFLNLDELIKSSIYDMRYIWISEWNEHHLDIYYHPRTGIKLSSSTINISMIHLSWTFKNLSETTIICNAYLK